MGGLTSMIGSQIVITHVVILVSEVSLDEPGLQKKWLMIGCFHTYIALKLEINVTTNLPPSRRTSEHGWGIMPQDSGQAILGVIFTLR